MIVPEVLHELPLVSSQRVGRHEAQDATSSNEVKNIDFTGQPLIGLIMHCHSLFALHETRALLDATTATYGKVVGAYVLPISECKWLAIENHLLELLLVLFC